ncbi:MAG: hypothetical protein HKP57_02185 [Halobacteria archaeon]|nr:hypothetical protein [Halobacteria archaeon]
MRRFAELLLILGCMLASGNLCALTAQDEKKAASSRDTAEEKHRPPVKQRAQQPAKPAATFKPSEKIGADSAVSFPVDI